MFVTDFNKSSIGWSGTSRGIFKLASIYTYYDKINKQQILYGLSQSVLAGNVYSEKNLIKDPFYIFQVAGDNNKQKIFRTDLPINKYNYNFFKKRKNIKDTFSSGLFKDFKIKIQKKKAVKNLIFKNIVKYFEANDFIVKIKFLSFHRMQFEIEFPVNHINILIAEKKWQIETGPILFPVDNHQTKNNFNLLPCFVHFNNFNAIDLFYDYPFGYRNQNTPSLKDINCEIELYSSL